MPASETWNDGLGRLACGPSQLSYPTSKLGGALVVALLLYLISMGWITGHL